MNRSRPKSSRSYSPKLCRSIWLGWNDYMTGQPPRAAVLDGPEATAQNYEAARHWAAEYKRVHGVRTYEGDEPPGWLKAFLLATREHCQDSDTCLPALIVGHEKYRPQYLIKADLANALRAAGLESLQPPQEEVY